MCHVKCSQLVAREEELFESCSLREVNGCDSSAVNSGGAVEINEVVGIYLYFASHFAGDCGLVPSVESSLNISLFLHAITPVDAYLTRSAECYVHFSFGVACLSSEFHSVVIAWFRSYLAAFFILCGGDYSDSVDIYLTLSGVLEIYIHWFV